MLKKEVKKRKNYIKAKNKSYSYKTFQNQRENQLLSPEKKNYESNIKDDID